MILELAAVSVGRNVSPFDRAVVDKRRITDTRRRSRDPPSESEPADSTSPQPDEETCGLTPIVNSILDREGDVASVIQRLSYRVDCTCELSQRARSYAIELRRHIARLGAILSRDGAPARERRSLEIKLKTTIEGLPPEEAKLVLIRFLLRHAGTPSEIVSSAGHQPKARMLEMLQRRAERERCRIARWINEHEAGLYERSDNSDAFDPRTSATAPQSQQGSIFDRKGPFGESMRARPTVFWS